jgi:hypothetical protein
VAEVTWNRSDQEGEKVINRSQSLTPRQHLVLLRDNPASFFEKIYARGGYARREIVKFIKNLQ